MESKRVVVLASHFVRGQLFSFVSGHLRSWVIVLLGGRSSSCVRVVFCGRGCCSWGRLVVCGRLIVVWGGGAHSGVVYILHGWGADVYGQWSSYMHGGGHGPSKWGVAAVSVLYSAPPIPAGILQESGHSSGILQESSHSNRIPVESIGIPLEFHWNKNGIKHTKVEILLYLSQFSSCADIYTFLFPCHFYTMFTPVLNP